MVELAQLSYLPMIVATSSHPASVATESLEVVACDLLKNSSHITHVVEGLQLLDIELFFLLPMPHSIQEGLIIIFILHVSYKSPSIL